MSCFFRHAELLNVIIDVCIFYFIFNVIGYKELKEISVIIVTHNSQVYINNLLSSIFSCGDNFQVVLVDSGSSCKNYLFEAKEKYNIDVLLEENVGFAKANNIGYRYINQDAKFVAFINPDLFIKNGWLRYAADFMSRSENNNVAVFSSALERFDINKQMPLGVYDSLGIDKNFFWYDIAQGKQVNKTRDKSYIVERKAICGALMFCRKSALDKASPDGQIFWEKLFMYKEDIELSLRLNSLGFRLLVDLNTINYHCRGWKDRKEIQKWAKVISARNDILVALRYKSIGILLFLVKYFYVRFIER